MKTSTKAGAAGLSAGVLALLITFVGGWEGRELRAYRDIVGVPTICYGETRGVQMGDVATPAECDSMLARGLSQFNAGLNRCLVTSLPDKVRVAFVSWSYNVGLGAACGSTLVKRANAGRLREACDQLLVWTRAGGRVVQGLVNRRKAEHALCLEGLG